MGSVTGKHNFGAGGAAYLVILENLKIPRRNRKKQKF